MYIIISANPYHRKLRNSQGHRHSYSWSNIRINIRDATSSAMQRRLPRTSALAIRLTLTLDGIRTQF